MCYPSQCICTYLFLLQKNTSKYIRHSSTDLGKISLHRFGLLPPFLGLIVVVVLPGLQSLLYSLFLYLFILCPECRQHRRDKVLRIFRSECIQENQRIAQHATILCNHLTKLCSPSEDFGSPIEHLGTHFRMNFKGKQPKSSTHPFENSFRNVRSAIQNLRLGASSCYERSQHPRKTPCCYYLL